MTVDATQFHVLSIDFEDLTHDVYTFYTDVIVKMFYGRPLAVTQFNSKGIEVWFLCRPETRMPKLTTKLHVHRVFGRKAMHATLDFLPFNEEDHVQVLHAFAAGVAQFHIGLDLCDAEICVGDSRNIVITDMHGRPHPELHRAEDATQTPHVDVLQIGSITPAIHFHCKAVLSFSGVACDVELSGRHGVLTVTHLLSVYPHIEGRFHAAEVENDILCQLLARKIKKGDVGTHGIAVVVCIPLFGRFAGHAGRIRLKGKLKVGIDGLTEVLHLPVSRHDDVIPLADIEISSIEVCGPLVRIGGPIEAPLPIE